MPDPQSAGVPVVAEAFADRGYAADGRLVPRSHPLALLRDPAEVAERVLRIATEGTLLAVDGPRSSPCPLARSAPMVTPPAPSAWPAPCAPGSRPPGWRSRRSSTSRRDDRGRASSGVDGRGAAGRRRGTAPGGGLPRRRTRARCRPARGGRGRRTGLARRHRRRARGPDGAAADPRGRRPGGPGALFELAGAGAPGAVVRLPTVSRHAGRGRRWRSQEVEIEVRYDGPDLDDVARLTGLSRAEVVAAHTGMPWRVAFGGFAPGFAYLVGGDPRLACHAATTPGRPSPPGRSASPGEFSGVYPRASPGGWQLLGTTALVLWDGSVTHRHCSPRGPPCASSTSRPRREPGARGARHRPALPGRGRGAPGPGGARRRAVRGRRPRRLPPRGPARRSPGGPGRPGGAPRRPRRPGEGPRHRRPHRGAGARERRRPGGRARGARRGPDGAVLSLGMPSAGLRTYLTVRGGIDVEPVLGSRSTDTLSGLGPPPVRVGDVLPVGDPGAAFPTRRPRRTGGAGLRRSPTSSSCSPGPGPNGSVGGAPTSVACCRRAGGSRATATGWGCG